MNTIIKTSAAVVVLIAASTGLSTVASAGCGNGKATVRLAIENRSSNQVLQKCLGKNGGYSKTSWDIRNRVGWYIVTGTINNQLGRNYYCTMTIQNDTSYGHTFHLFTVRGNNSKGGIIRKSDGFWGAFVYCQDYRPYQQYPPYSY